MIISTVNVNGIRAAVRRGMMQWVQEQSPDVLLLQEVRAPAAVAAEQLGEDWLVTTHPSDLKGRAGVAVALRRERFEGAQVTVQTGLGPEDTAADTGRWLEVCIDGDLTVVSAYLHSGSVGTEKQDAKMAYLPRVQRRLADLKARGSALVAGDFNVVRDQRDIKNWKPNHNRTAGVLDEEMVYLNRWAEDWRDVVRDLAGDRQGPYTWWSWRGKAYDNDAGWRIDYQYATADLAQHAESFSVYRAPTWESRFSDHAPVTVHYRR